MLVKMLVLLYMPFIDSVMSVLKGRPRTNRSSDQAITSISAEPSKAQIEASNEGHAEAMACIAAALEKHRVGRAVRGRAASTAMHTRRDQDLLRAPAGNLYGIPPQPFVLPRAFSAASAHLIFGRKKIFSEMPNVGREIEQAIQGAQQKVGVAAQMLLSGDPALLSRSLKTVATLFGLSPASALTLLHPLAHQFIRIGGALNFLLSSAWDNVGMVTSQRFSDKFDAVAAWSLENKCLIIDSKRFPRRTFEAQVTALLHECSHAAARAEDHFYLKSLNELLPQHEQTSPDRDVGVNLATAKAIHTTISDPKGRWAQQAPYYIQEGTPTSHSFFKEQEGDSLHAAVNRFHRDEEVRKSILLHNADSLVVSVLSLNEIGSASN